MPSPREPSDRRDRRAAQRHPVIAPVVWTGGRGISENMSTTGIYFVTTQPLTVGRIIAVTIAFAEEARRFSRIGRIVRVDPRGTAFGVGLEFQ